MLPPQLRPFQKVKDEVTREHPDWPLKKRLIEAGKRYRKRRGK